MRRATRSVQAAAKGLARNQVEARLDMVVLVVVGVHLVDTILWDEFG